MEVSPHTPSPLVIRVGTRARRRLSHSLPRRPSAAANHGKAAGPEPSITVEHVLAWLQAAREQHEQRGADTPEARVRSESVLSRASTDSTCSARDTPSTESSPAFVGRGRYGLSPRKRRGEPQRLEAMRLEIDDLKSALTKQRQQTKAVEDTALQHAEESEALLRETQAELREAKRALKEARRSKENLASTLRVLEEEHASKPKPKAEDGQSEQQQRIEGLEVENRRLRQELSSADEQLADSELRRAATPSPATLAADTDTDELEAEESLKAEKEKDELWQSQLAEAAECVREVEYLRQKNLELQEALEEQAAAVDPRVSILSNEVMDMSISPIAHRNSLHGELMMSACPSPNLQSPVLMEPRSRSPLVEECWTEESQGHFHALALTIKMQQAEKVTIQLSITELYECAKSMHVPSTKWKQFISAALVTGLPPVLDLCL